MDKEHLNTDKYTILTSSNPSGLIKKVIEKTKEGFVAVGSHQVVTIYSQNKFSGSQHMATQHDLEYSQTMISESVLFKN